MYNRVGQPRRWAVYCLIATASLVFSRPALAEYHLAPGDTVEVAVYGIPDQHYRALVQTDGSVTLPGVGTVAVEGLTQAELQQRMETLLPTKIFRYRTQDGQEHPVVLRPADVAASIAEYRPVYISGDVLTPGQQSFRPQMTVRQLVAMAGGYSLLRSRVQQGMDPAELQKEYQSASIEYAKEYFHSLRLQAELQNKDTFQPQGAEAAPATSPISSALVKSEAEALRVSQNNFRAEQTFLQDAVKKDDGQLGVLKTQEQQEAQGVAADNEDLERLGKLFSAGNLTAARVTDARRAMLLSSTRHLQTQVEVMRLQRQQDDQRRQLDRLAAERKERLLTELNGTNAKLAELDAAVKAARQRLQPTGGGGPALVDPDKMKPEVAIVRNVNGQWSRKVTSPDTELEPGDVVEAALRPEVVPSQ